MIKKALLLLGFACVAGMSVQAQKCVTDEVNNKYLQQHPEIAVYNQQLEREIADNIQKLTVNAMMRGTVDDTDTAYLTIPVVVHVIHDYGAEYVSDDKIYQLIDDLNAVYSKMNTTQLAGVIPTFQPYIGNMHIRFRLATKDPGGNPTHGITRNRTYLTIGGDDQAKLDYWPQNAYLNIWFERVIGMGTGGAGIVAAYSNYPSSAAANPLADGLIANYQFISTGNTVQHEIGHYFNLSHPWGNNNSAGVTCGDDNVDDTPPTQGRLGGCNVYDVTCAVNYVRNGIDYPDTTNVQNIMDYADCELMFTKGQVQRARAALRSNIGSRSNLWSPTNIAATGAGSARPSLPPVADFNANRYFGCAATLNFSFVNRSWNDTLTSASWTFSNGASQPVSTSTTGVVETFSAPGWVTATLAATGNGGTSTISKQMVYVADPVAVAAQDYYGEFTPGSDVDKYPIFNYYNTNRKWEVANNAGYYDSYSMRYINKDTRTTNNQLATNTPEGDYADFYTPAIDISGSQFTSAAKLTFFSAGTSRTGQLNDKLEINYSTDCGNIWRVLDTLTDAEVANNATQSTDFTPQAASQWVLRSITLPTLAKGPRVFFRFRYRPGVNTSSRGLTGTGNNFYIDRINVTSNPAGINEQELNAEGIAIAPNPTTGNAWIMLSSKNTGDAQVHVTDITGKVVYRTSQALSGTTRIEIPASALTVKGMYLVQVLTNNQSYTKKLVVY